MKNGESLEFNSYEEAYAAFQAALAEPLTTHKIADNSQGRHPKRYIGLSMKCHGFPDHIRHMIPGHLDGRELAPGQIDTTDISDGRHICIEYYFWYDELINGQWISVNPGKTYTAGPGKYWKRCIMQWVPAKYSSDGSANAPDCLVIDLDEADLPVTE
jgi:hypothetical protein